MRNVTIEKDLEWLCEHQEISEKYRGKYIAIIDKKVVAHGKSLHEVLNIAERLGEEPLISFIPQEETLIL